jgi:hypothetical protein
MTADEIAEIFPNLKNYQITSPADYRYNCIAWAADDTKNWWQPSDAPYFFWLRDDRSDSLENFVKTFNILGYKEETDSALEPKFEKIALYTDADGLPSHATRQNENGLWTSKLGEAEDIEHDTPEALEGEAYGAVKIILKRPRTTK